MDELSDIVGNAFPIHGSVLTSRTLGFLSWFGRRVNEVVGELSGQQTKQLLRDFAILQTVVGVFSSRGELTPQGETLKFYICHV